MKIRAIAFNTFRTSEAYLSSTFVGVRAVIAVAAVTSIVMALIHAGIDSMNSSIVRLDGVLNRA